MRAVLDTNILVSALIAPAGNPAAIYNAWEQGKFTLLTCTEHLDEVRATLQKPRVANLIKPACLARNKTALSLVELPLARKYWRRAVLALSRLECAVTESGDSKSCHAAQIKSEIQ